MLHYTLKRILLAIPTFVGISLVVFFISINTPGDPIQMIIGERTFDLENDVSRANIETKIREVRSYFHLDLPPFYFTITDQTQSDTLHRIPDHQMKKHLSKLAFENGNWKNVNEYHKSINRLTSEAYADQTSSKNKALHLIEELKKQQTTEELMHLLASFKLVTSNENLIFAYKILEYSILQLNAHTDISARYVPQFIWNGAENQYRYWMADFFSGDFGTSYKDRKPVGHKIGTALKWTVLISILSIILSYSIGIPLGVYSAKHQNSPMERLLSTFLFSIHSIPSFWLASLLIIFFASYEYFPIFPSYGLGDWNENSSALASFLDLIYHLLLPIVCWSYSSIAYISEQTKRSMLNELSADYIRTGRAKGLTENQLYWKHALKNASFPLITQIGNLFPALISGSFIIEYIFAIPGVGKLLLDSIALRDYPVVFSILMISAVLILIGTLISDLLYLKMDQRVSYSKQWAS
ncbi:ABC transporter permease [bacterium]|nr:ABC transporter permease [bacterium]